MHGVWSPFIHVRLFATPWTVAHQTPLSMGFSRQEYWSGLPYPPPGDLPNPGVKPRSPSLQVDFLPSEPPGNPRVLKNYAKSTLLMPYKWNNKTWMTEHLFTTWLTEYLSPLLRHRAQKKRFLSKYYSLLTMHLVTQELWWKCMTSLINVVFMPSNTTSILQSMDQGIILAFKSYYLRNKYIS